MAVAAIIYSAAILLALSQGGFVLVNFTAADNTPSTFTFDEHILINRVLYIVLALAILGAIFSKARYIKITLSLITAILLYFEFAGGIYYFFGFAVPEPVFSSISSYTLIGAFSLEVLWGAILASCTSLALMSFFRANEKSSNQIE